MSNNRTFRNSASFGKRIEYWIIGLLLKSGFDVFVPLVDDDGIDLIIRGENGRKLDVQVKARSDTVAFGSAALFTTGLSHTELRNDFFFVFYSERLDAIWVMSSKDYLDASVQKKSGKYIGARQIWMNGRNSKLKLEHTNPKFDTWLIGTAGSFDFSVLQKALVL